MKVLHLNTTDMRGGAARAAYRIHKGLLDQEFPSKMLVQKKESDEPKITTPYNTTFRNILGSLRPYVNAVIQKMQKTTNPILHSCNILPSGLPKIINKSDADIVHLHWINNGMISIEEIAKINKPIVWTLHDMWVFSGSEHCDDLENPGRFKKGYYKQNRPPDYSAIDIDRWTWIRKKRAWQDINFNFVTPSTWLANCLKESRLFRGKETTVIPNGLDTAIFRPVDKKRARGILNLEEDRKVVLYGAMGAESNPIKGYHKLLKAKSHLLKEGEADKITFVVFGNEGKRIDEEEGVRTHFLGRINDNRELALIYSAADVMTVPSLMEAFGQTASEAMACGTPVVAFDATGLKDIVDHKENGYLATPYDPRDLAAGIEWIIEDEERNKELSKKARTKVEKEFDIKNIAAQYISLYDRVLN